MPELLVIADAPDEITLANGKATSQVQIAKTGKFTDPRYGKFSITLADFQKWITNFTKLNKNEGRLGLPVDVDHAPEKRGETEAAGWITALSIKSNELWATVEWNELGKSLVADRRYAYLSPSYVANYKDESGADHGTALLGVALTNRPFLSMATVSLSRAGHTVEEIEASNPTTPEKMADFKNIATKLRLADDADEATILAKLEELSQKPPAPVSLESQASAEGKVVLSTDQFQSLQADATAGADAAKQLSQMRFDGAFDKAVSLGKALPAQKEMFSTLYAANADSTLALLDGLHPVVNMEPAGSSATPEGHAVALSAEMKAEAGEFGSPDADRIKLHERAVALSAEKSIEYVDALLLAETEGVR